MADEVAKLTGALARLAGKAIPNGSLAMTQFPFGEFTALCEELFPNTLGITKDGKFERQSGHFALINLLRSVGLPETAGAPATDSIARNIVAAMTARTWARVYMCPLDLAGDLPRLNFGPCEIRQFDRRELEDLLQIGRLRRQFQNMRLDTGGLSDFHWLIVRDDRPVTRPAGSRAFPWLDFRFDRDFGAIDPHPRVWPEIVEQAVFGLMQLPWEEMVTDANFEWRGFRIPWIYVVDHDPFASPNLPQGPETLSRQPQIYVDQNTGEEVEIERPLQYGLNDDLDNHWATLNDAWWARLQRVIASPIVNPLVTHFVVRAFRSDDIDEFLGQMVTIEAAIAMERDHGLGAPRPKIPGNAQGATLRVARRAGAITSDPAAAVLYNKLFNLRSAFIHGRPLAEISSEKRVAARTLARRVISGLLNAADAGTHQDRTAYLTSLCP